MVPSKPVFSVSKYGEVMFTSTGKILSPWKDKDGYLRVNNCSAGNKKHYIAVHRAVAEVFVENTKPLEFKIVNHLDNIKSNNYYKNLEWTTHSLNRAHSINFNGNESVRNNVKLKESEVHSICKMLSLGLRIIDISKNIGVSVANINSIKAGKAWNHISCSYPKLKVERRNTLSKMTLEWIADQLIRGKTKEDILLMSTRLTHEDMDRALELLNILDCNDYR